MKIGENEKYIFNHVKIRDTGSLLPVVFDIENGYRRGGWNKTEDGEYVALFGVSNIKADEQKMGYELKENEKTSAIFGMIIHNQKEAEVLSEFFKQLANEIT